MQKWKVELKSESKKEIERLLRSKKVSIEVKKRCQILKDIDESDGRNPLSVKRVTVKRGVCENTVINVRRDFAENGFEAAITRKKRETPPIPGKVTGEVEAYIIATACSVAPEGKTRWTQQMLADKIVLDGLVESISGETVRLVLKKHSLSLI